MVITARLQCSPSLGFLPLAAANFKSLGKSRELAAQQGVAVREMNEHLGDPGSHSHPATSGCQHWVQKYLEISGWNMGFSKGRDLSRV